MVETCTDDDAIVQFIVIYNISGANKKQQNPIKLTLLNAGLTLH
jgi:hypothetical protein